MKIIMKKKKITKNVEEKKEIIENKENNENKDKNVVNNVEGKKDNLKAISGWDETCTKNLTNGKYGFDAFPGYQQGDAQSYTLNMARFWAATTTRHVVGLSCYETDGYLLISNPANFAVSVRCIKDSE